jgi:hypothetical protein
LIQGHVSLLTFWYVQAEYGKTKSVAVGLALPVHPPAYGCKEECESQGDYTQALQDGGGRIVDGDFPLPTVAFLQNGYRGDPDKTTSPAADPIGADCATRFAQRDNPGDRR